VFPLTFQAGVDLYPTITQFHNRTPFVLPIHHKVGILAILVDTNILDATFPNPNQFIAFAVGTKNDSCVLTTKPNQKEEKERWKYGEMR
jgi:hypothetical protein